MVKPQDQTKTKNIYKGDSTSQIPFKELNRNATNQQKTQEFYSVENSRLKKSLQETIDERDSLAKENKFFNRNFLEPA